MPRSRPPHGEGVVLLASGGLDSTALLALLMDVGPISLLHFDFGQPARLRERVAVESVAAHYQVSLQVHALSIPVSTFDALPGRNGWFLHSALLTVWPFTGSLAIATHGGTAYPDSTADFIDKMQLLFDAYTGGLTRVLAPFRNWTKQDIVDFAHMKGVPLSLTYSCDLGRDQPCGACVSCEDVERRSARP